MNDPPATRPAADDTPDAPARILSSDTLFGPAREVLIRHGVETYRLRMTRQDKLILTK